jgi:hypothetical protein
MRILMTIAGLAFLSAATFTASSPASAQDGAYRYRNGYATQYVPPQHRWEQLHQGAGGY